MREPIDDDTVAKQFEAVRRSGVAVMVDRESVSFWAYEVGYDQLVRWINCVSADWYLLKTKEFVENYYGADISPYSPIQVFELQNEAQQETLVAQDER